MPLIAGLAAGLAVALLELLELPGPWSECYGNEIRLALVADVLAGLLGGVLLWLLLRVLRLRPRPLTVVRIGLVAGVAVYLGMSFEIGRLFGQGLPPTVGLLCLALALPLLLSVTSVRAPLRRGLMVAALVTVAVLDLLEPRTLVVPSRSAPQPQASAPNVVVVIWDAARRDHTSAHGYAERTTPHLTALAREGVTYVNAYSPATWTLPSHASLFTGLYPSAHGTDDEHPTLSEGVKTLPEALSGAGYETAAFVANAWLAATHGFAQGFDVFFEGWRRRRLFADVVTDNSPLLLGRYTDKGAGMILGAVSRWLDERDATRPYFLFLNLIETHPDFWPEEPYRDEFLRTTSSLRASVVAQTAYGLLAGAVEWTARDRQVIRELYDGEIAYVDAVTARLRAQLQARAGGRPTLFVVTADHGSGLGEQNLLGAIGFSEELASIPFVVQMPGVFEGGTVRRTPVSLVDIAPTVLDVARLPNDALGPLPGRSLVALEREGVVDRRVFCENERRVTNMTSLDEGYGHHPAWLETRSKAAWSRQAGLIWASDGTVTARGPLAGDTAVAETPVETLESEIVAAVGAPEAGMGRPSRHVVTAAQREQLRALGYVQ